MLGSWLAIALAWLSWFHAPLADSLSNEGARGEGAKRTRGTTQSIVDRLGRSRVHQAVCSSGEARVEWVSRIITCWPSRASHCVLEASLRLSMLSE